MSSQWEGGDSDGRAAEMRTVGSSVLHRVTSRPLLPPQPCITHQGSGAGQPGFEPWLSTDSCVTLGKFLYFSVPVSPTLQ